MNTLENIVRHFSLFIKQRYVLIGLITLAIGFCRPNTTLAQSPKTELRAVWVASVSNLDWPSGNNRFDMATQQNQLIDMLDLAVTLNLNTIFLQIRPQSDALYESNLVPWSEYISGTRGTSPGYDPLAFAIEEAHKRGLELHGWLNPYRYETSNGKNDGKPGDFNADHPEWMLTYSDHKIFNPGVPEVIDHLKDVVGEIVNNYDIDGIHFDDYFYPYEGTSDEDLATFTTYGAGFANIGDWRRDNVTKMMAIVNDTIQSVKPFVRFGVSPFGIYGNGQNPPGIVGLDAYNTIYTDPVQWMKDESIDYVCPQLYWPTEGGQDFATLLPWWATQAKENNRHVIAGHGIYRLASNASTSRVNNQLHESKQYFDQSVSAGRINAAAWTLDQITLQIDIVRASVAANAVGSVFFRFQDFNRVDGLADHLGVISYGDQSLMPAMTWKNQAVPTAPSNIHWEEDMDGVFYLTWDEADPSHRYVLYGSDEGAPVSEILDDPSNIVKVLYNNQYYFDETTESVGHSNLFVTAYDRYGNESSEAATFEVLVPDLSSTLIAPVHTSGDLPWDFDFSWSSAENAQTYKIEISTSSNFSTIDFEENINSTSVNAQSFALLGDQVYYWRITPFNFLGPGPASEVFSFDTGFPANPIEIQPSDDQELVDLEPLITWKNDPQANGGRIQIAIGGEKFESFNMVIDENLSGANSFQIPSPLKEWTTYHIRLKVENALGESHWVETSFKTLITLPEAPNIISPLPNTVIEPSTVMDISWEQTAIGTGYHYLLSTDIDRLQVVDEGIKFASDDTDQSYENLAGGEYYFNVAGRNVGGDGAWAQVKFSVAQVQGIHPAEQEKVLKVYYSEDDQIRISVAHQAGRLLDDLRIFDVFGRQVMAMKNAQTISDSERTIYQIALGKLPKIGIVVLNTSKGIYSTKIITR